MEANQTAEAGLSEEPARGRLLIPLLVAVDVFAIDQFSKWWATANLTDSDVDVIGSLRFNLIRNSGMAFSRAQGMGSVIALFAIALVIGLIAFMRRVPDLRTAVPLALIAGGAVGNLSDRLFRGDGFLNGAVIDFIDLQWWPIFNVADMGVVVGGVALLVFGRIPSAS